VYSGEGYNPVNTVAYAIILGISLFAILKLMDILKIRLDERFVISTAPYILFGASLRVIQDVGILRPPFSTCSSPLWLRPCIRHHCYVLLLPGTGT
jgi:uncharacterized membrane protein